VALVAGAGTTAFGRVLYSGAGLPSAEGWTYNSAPVAATQTQIPGGVHLDTTLNNAIYAGYAYQLQPGELNRSPGFRLSFTLQLASESHSDNTRAGLAVSVLTSDSKQVEFSFWPGAVLTPNVNFTSFAASAAYDTTAKTTYLLDVLGDSYSLSTAGGTPLLNGNLLAYDPGPLSGNPYAAFYNGRDVVAVSDNTSRASSVYRFYSASLVPEPSSLACLPCAAVLYVRKRRN
jgi:hypothetical protein